MGKGGTKGQRKKRKRKRKRGGRGKWSKTIFEEITAKSFQNDERHTFPNSGRPEDTKKINAKKLTLHTSQSNCNLKERQRKRGRKKMLNLEKNDTLHTVITIKIMTSFSSETVKSRKKLNNIFKVLEEKECQPRQNSVSDENILQK